MPLIEKFTHGGFPASQALHWDKENYQKLGNIVKNLMSTDQEKEKQAYIDYHNLKRHFLSSEFENKIDELEKYREARKFPGIRDALVLVRGYFVKENIEIYEQPQIPEYKEKGNTMKSRITEITYSKLKNIDNFENVRVEAKAIIAEGEKPSEVMKKVKAWVENQTKID